MPAILNLTLHENVAENENKKKMIFSLHRHNAIETNRTTNQLNF